MMKVLLSTFSWHKARDASSSVWLKQRLRQHIDDEFCVRMLLSVHTMDAQTHTIKINATHDAQLCVTCSSMNGVVHHERTPLCVSCTLWLVNNVTQTQQVMPFVHTQHLLHCTSRVMSSLSPCVFLDLLPWTQFCVGATLLGFICSVTNTLYIIHHRSHCPLLGTSAMSRRTPSVDPICRMQRGTQRMHSQHNHNKCNYWWTATLWLANNVTQSQVMTIKFALHIYPALTM